MSKKLDGEKLVVSKATSKETEWLRENRGLFAVAYSIPTRLRKEWPCFVLKKGKEIIGYRSFQFHESGGKNNAWVGSTSLRKGFEGKGLGPFLVGRANSMLHSMGFDVVRTWAHEPKAKKFWAKQGFQRVGGDPMEARGNTQLSLNLKNQRETKRRKRIV